MEGGERAGAGVVVEASSDAAYVALFRSEFSSVFRTAYAMLGDVETAREVTQEAFTRLYAHWSKISRYEKPGAWVRRVAIRLATRSRRRRLTEIMSDRRTDAAAPADGTDQDLVRAIRSLPAGERAAIILFYFDDLPVADVAEILRCSESAVKVRLHRARKRLGEVLGEEVGHVG